MAGGHAFLPALGRRFLEEVRSDCPGNRMARLLFSVVDGKIVVLHGFIKKTQKTPDDDLKLARRRKREFDR